MTYLIIFFIFTLSSLVTQFPTCEFLGTGFKADYTEAAESSVKALVTYERVIAGL